MDSLDPTTVAFVVFLFGVALGFAIGWIMNGKRRGGVIKRLTELVKPSMFDISDHFADTFSHHETEVVARNIIWICTNNGDRWLEFSFNDYRRMCQHKVTSAEHSELETLKRGGFLQEANGSYQITDKFIAKLWGFVRTEGK